jgi:hypothetical protein
MKGSIHIGVKIPKLITASITELLSSDILYLNHLLFWEAQYEAH